LYGTPLIPSYGHGFGAHIELKHVLTVMLETYKAILWICIASLMKILKSNSESLITETTFGFC